MNELQQYRGLACTRVQALLSNKKDMPLDKTLLNMEEDVCIAFLNTLRYAAHNFDVNQEINQKKFRKSKFNPDIFIAIKDIIAKNKSYSVISSVPPGQWSVNDWKTSIRHVSTLYDNQTSKVGDKKGITSYPLLLLY
jgi:hypothetical protein